MKRKIKALVAVGLVLAMLAGCGEQGVSSNSETSSKEVSNATENSDSIEESKYPEYLNLESARPIVKDGEEITLKVAIQRASVAETPVDELWFVHFLKEKMNINLEIEWLTTETVAERKSLMLASNDLPDILLDVSVTSDEFVKYGVEEGMFLPLSDYVSEELTPNMLALWEDLEEYMKYYIASDGKIYTIPAIESNVGKLGYADTLPIYRVFPSTRYMEAAGISELPDTLDGFTDMLRAFKKLDPAEFGVDEIWPIVAGATKYEKLYIQNAFGWIISTGDCITQCYDIEKGEVVIPCLEEKYADYLAYWNTLYTEGLIHPDYFTLDRDTIRAYESERKVGVLIDAAPYLTDAENFDEYVCALPLKSEWNKTGAISGAKVTKNPGSIFISSSTEYPELCMRLLDYLCSAEGATYYMCGCPAGSEDTLDLISGYRVKDDLSGIYYEEVEAGAYESAFAYQNNEIALTQGAFITKTISDEYQFVLAGVDTADIPETKLDLTDPDQHYRWLCATAAEGHLVEQMPSIYIPSEDAERYTDLKALLSTYVESESAKFIVGQRPLSEVADFIEELKAMGGDEYRQIVLDACADYAGPAN